MYKIGDLTFYKSHGVCRVERIQEESFTGEPKLYYVLQSKLRPGVTLYHPVESDNSQLEKISTYSEAMKILECFDNKPSNWEDKNTNRQRLHNDTLNRNNHLEIAQLMNTLLNKEIELQKIDKKLTNQDSHTLQQISVVIYDVLELALKKPKEELEKEILKKIAN